MNVFEPSVSLPVRLPPHRGQDFIVDHLRMQDVSCYWERLLAEYGRLLTYTPKRRSGYKQIVHRPSRTEL